MARVIFTSNRPLERAENLKTVFDAYDGEKEFRKFVENPRYEEYDLQVTDELVNDAAQKCLFIGHAMGAGKTYGLDQPHPYFYRPDMITRAIASSEDVAPIVANQIGIKRSQVCVTGLPRMDKFRKSKKDGKRVYLYAPTFRGKDGRIDIDCGYLARNMTDNEEFIIKPHTVTGRIGKWRYEAVKEVDAMEPTKPYLEQADVLITDYSSIMFDALAAEIPVVLFEKDHEKYLRRRGMYFEYPDKYSSYHVRNETRLLQTCRAATWNKRLESLRKFYAGACDGRATERVIKLIKEML